MVERGLCRPHVNFLDGSGVFRRAYLHRYQGLVLLYNWRPLEVLIDARGHRELFVKQRLE